MHLPAKPGNLPIIRSLAFLSLEPRHARKTDFPPFADNGLHPCRRPGDAAGVSRAGQLRFQGACSAPAADGSPTQAQEIDKLLELQAHRTPQEEARCKDEADATAFIFADVLGKGFDATDLPRTAALLKDAARQAKIVGGAAKAQWNRRRPFIADARIKPCVDLEQTPSYPSGHATRGMVWALLLAEIYPEHRDALLARGREFGEDRSLAGLHYPSDVAAGQKLGEEIARRMLADPEFRARLDKAKEETLSHAHA